MSTKEVRRWELNLGDGCKSDRCYAEISVQPDGDYVLLSDHLAAMAEKDATVEKFKRSEIVNAIKCGQDYGDALDEIANLKQTIASQARVTSWLKSLLEAIAEGIYTKDGAQEEAQRFLDVLSDPVELAAIEKAGAKDE